MYVLKTGTQDWKSVNKEEDRLVRGPTELQTAWIRALLVGPRRDDREASGRQAQQGSVSGWMQHTGRGRSGGLPRMSGWGDLTDGAHWESRRKRAEGEPVAGNNERRMTYYGHINFEIWNMQMKMSKRQLELEAQESGLTRGISAWVTNTYVTVKII